MKIWNTHTKMISSHIKLAVLLSPELSKLRLGQQNIMIIIELQANKEKLKIYNKKSAFSLNEIEFQT